MKVSHLSWKDLQVISNLGFPCILNKLCCILSFFKGYFCPVLLSLSSVQNLLIIFFYNEYNKLARIYSLLVLCWHEYCVKKLRKRHKYIILCRNNDCILIVIQRARSGGGASLYREGARFHNKRHDTSIFGKMLHMPGR